MCTGGSGGDGGAAERRRQEEARQARIRAGNQAINNTFSQFDDDFYKGRETAYLDFANPQIQDQYQDAFEQLRKRLAMAGLSQSSESARRMGKLEKQLGEQQLAAAQRAAQAASEARGSIESARSGLQSQNMNMADPALASQNALERATRLNQIPVFDPLTNLFAGVAEGLSTQADLERRGKSKYNTGLFGTSDASKVVGS